MTSNYLGWAAIPQEAKVERLTQLIRVLRALSPHERKKHFDMGRWGGKTRCGTKACAAGHAGMDPWFRRQGFSMRVSGLRRRDDGYRFTKLAPMEFFGPRVFSGVFTNSHIHAVRTAIAALNKQIQELQGEGT